MKTIELKVLPASENNPETNYRNTLLGVVRQGGVNGVTMDVVRKSLRLLDILEQANDWEVVSFNDDEHSVLMMRMNNAAWGGVSRNIVQLMDDVEHAKAQSSDNGHHQE